MRRATPKRRSPAAAALRSGLYRLRVVRNRRAYKRRTKHRKKSQEIV